MGLDESVTMDLSETDVYFSLLMQRARRGSSSSYAELLKKITPLLKSYVKKMIFQSNDHDDIVQVILLSIHEASHKVSTKPFFFNMDVFHCPIQDKGLFKSILQ